MAELVGLSGSVTKRPGGAYSPTFAIKVGIKEREVNEEETLAD